MMNSTPDSDDKENVSANVNAVAMKKSTELKQEVRIKRRSRAFTHQSSSFF